MKAIFKSDIVNVPEGVKVEMKERKVKVTGPRGVLEREFKHVSVEMTTVSASKIRVGIWFGVRKELACIRTVCKHIENMIKGVTKGFQFKMRSAYCHFPINISIVDNKKCIEIRNYMGEKRVRRIQMSGDVTVETTDQKDEIVVRGNNVEDVSQSAAKIQQSTAAKNKDCRIFLDGIYVSERGTIVA
jgi:large subunit ribosomal protein L9e